MAAVVIDAQVVAGFYKESVLGLPHECSGSPAVVIDRLTVDAPAFIDDGRQIESEWARVAEREWFEAWLADVLGDDRVQYVKAVDCTLLLRELRRACSFPATGGDHWYVRTACGAVARVDRDVALVTEDCDFFDPAAKQSGARRAKALSSCSGRVAKRLKKERIRVRTVRAQIEAI